MLITFHCACTNIFFKNFKAIKNYSSRISFSRVKGKAKFRQPFFTENLVDLQVLASCVFTQCAGNANRNFLFNGKSLLTPSLREKMQEKSRLARFR